MIRLKKLNNYDYNEPVTILIPEIPSLSLNNISEVTIKRLEQKEIQIRGISISSFIADSCKIGAMSLDFPARKDQQHIRINKANQINTFTASVQGTGKILLETIGINNQMSLSDSIKVEATYDLIRRLSIRENPRVPNK